MKIDYAATQKRLKFVKVDKFAREHGLSASSVRRIVANDYPTLTSPVALRVLSALRDAGFLVEMPDDEEQQAA